MEIKAASAYVNQSKLKALVHGHSGAGKSRLLATAKRPVIACCERQAIRVIQRTNPNADVALIETPDDLRAFIGTVKARVAKGDAPWDTIGLDSLTEMMRIFRIGKMREGGDSKDTLTQGEWGIIIDRTMNAARAFRDVDLHVLILTLSMRIGGDDEDTKLVPSVNGKALPDDLAGLVQVEGYQFKQPQDDGSVIYRVAFEAPSKKIATKGDPDLDPVEVPYWPHLIAKAFGADAPGAELLPEEELLKKGRQASKRKPKDEKKDESKKD